LNLPVLGIVLQFIFFFFGPVWIYCLINIPKEIRINPYWTISIIGSFLVIVGSAIIIIQKYFKLYWLLNLGLLNLIFGMLFFYIGFLSVNIYLKKMYQQKKIDALTDCLTGLPNKRMMEMILHKEISRCKRDNSSFCLMILDIDNFKVLNDTHGHLFGDFVLIEIAKTLVNTVRNYDTVFRYAGDEFVVLLPNLKKQDASRIEERLKNNLKKLNNKLPVDIGLSVGAAWYPYDAEKIEDLFRIADIRMYENKQGNKLK